MLPFLQMFIFHLKKENKNLKSLCLEEINNIFTNLKVPLAVPFFFSFRKSQYQIIQFPGMYVLYNMNKEKIYLYEQRA